MWATATGYLVATRFGNVINSLFRDDLILQSFWTASHECRTIYKSLFTVKSAVFPNTNNTTLSTTVRDELPTMSYPEKFEGFMINDIKKWTDFKKQSVSHNPPLEEFNCHVTKSSFVKSTNTHFS